MFERTRKRDTILKNVIKTHRIQSCLKPTFVSPKVRGYMVSVSYAFVGVFFVIYHRYRPYAYENLDQPILKLSYNTNTCLTGI